MQETFLDRIDEHVVDRGEFITKTYSHVLMAMLAFVGIEYYFFTSGLAPKIAGAMQSVPWLVILGAFMILSYAASHVASRVTSSPALQYAALGAFVLMWAVMFVPMLYMADTFAPGAIKNAGYMTAAAFVCLTAVVFITRKDFSFLRPFLMWGGLVALGVIVYGAISGSLGSMGYWFSLAMVLYAGGAVLYDTSNIAHHYRTDQHVAAALALFSSIALMLWYLVQLFMSNE